MTSSCSPIATGMKFEMRPTKFEETIIFFKLYIYHDTSELISGARASMNEVIFIHVMDKITKGGVCISKLMYTYS